MALRKVTRHWKASSKHRSDAPSYEDGMRVAVVALRTYAPLHVGNEPWKRVTKSGWPFIPGWTLYGAVAHALMKLTCTEQQAGGEKCLDCISDPNPACGYARLLLRTKRESKERIRFSPLVLSNSQQNAARYDALAYSRDAGSSQLKTALLPRAPIDRKTGSIYGDRLHGVDAHAPFQQYRGFIHVDAGFVDTLQKALLCLSFFPFGGARGKFCQVEAGIEQLRTPNEFLPRRAPLSARLLTPAILKPDRLRSMDLESISDFSMKRYRTWRTGLYRQRDAFAMYGATGFDESGGHSPPAGRAQDTVLDVRPHRTPGDLGLADGCVLRFRAGSEEKLKRLFLRGVGSKDTTYLGWGQLLFDGGTDGH